MEISILHDLTNYYIETPCTFPFIFMDKLDSLVSFPNNIPLIFSIIKHSLNQRLLTIQDLVHLAIVYADNDPMINIIKEVIKCVFPIRTDFIAFFDSVPDPERFMLARTLNLCLGGEDGDSLFRFLM